MGRKILKEKFQKFCRPFFFRSTVLIFRALSPIKTLFWPNFLRQRQKFEEKNAKKVFLGTFWKILAKNCIFSAYCPLKLVYIGTKGFATKNEYLKMVQRLGPLGRQGVESLLEGASALFLNPPLIIIQYSKI